MSKNDWVYEVAILSRLYHWVDVGDLAYKIRL